MTSQVLGLAFWPSGLLFASDFSGVPVEHQDSKNTACEGDKEGG